MTLEEAKKLADNGDFNAIMALGGYYFGDTADEENRDINEAIKWYELGAGFGYSKCMLLASMLCNINGHVLRKIVSGNPDIIDSIEFLKRGMSWAEKAKVAGEPGADEQIASITGELGISYFYYARGGEFSHPTKSEAMERYSTAIRLLKSVYTKTLDAEVIMFLALSLNYYGELCGYTDDNNKLEMFLYHKCVDTLFGKVVHSDIASMYLGLMYMEGRGCRIDYDKAYFYLKKAHDAGFDCSDILVHFKKKLFGGYTIV